MKGDCYTYQDKGCMLPVVEVQATCSRIFEDRCHTLRRCT